MALSCKPRGPACQGAEEGCPCSRCTVDHHPRALPTHPQALTYLQDAHLAAIVLAIPVKHDFPIERVKLQGGQCVDHPLAPIVLVVSTTDDIVCVQQLVHIPLCMPQGSRVQSEAGGLSTVHQARTTAGKHSYKLLRMPDANAHATH